MGMPLRRLQREMTYVEFIDWVNYFISHPFGESAADRRHAKAVSNLLAPHVEGEIDPYQFTVTEKKPKPKPPSIQQQRQAAKRFASMTQKKFK